MCELRFMDLSGVPDLKDGEVDPSFRGGPKILLLTSREHDDATGYLAVSWRRVEAHRVRYDGCDTRALFRYYVEKSSEDPYRSNFPDWFMDGVTRFAQSERIDKIWID